MLLLEQTILSTLESRKSEIDDLTTFAANLKADHHQRELKRKGKKRRIY